MTMTSPPNAMASGGKSSNPSANSPLRTTQNRTTSPSLNSTRRSDCSGRSAGSSSTLASPRNTQNRKTQHKASRRPRFVDEDDMAESTALRSANSRRGQTSITHLMNFSLPPRPHHFGNGIGRTPRHVNVYGIGSGRHSVDKARYVHANYRFIVKPNRDYKQHSMDADQHINWDDVLQLLASAQSQEASCPICLSHPTAARMAKCGHIFCLPCLIRYMHSTDDSPPLSEKRARWKKCPICWDSVYVSDTRPVRWFTGQEGPLPSEGDDVVLRLVIRQPGNTLALPRDGADTLGIFEGIPWYFAAEVTDYARIMKGCESYMVEQYDREIVELQEQGNEDELMFGEKPEWTRKAVQAVNEAKGKLQGIGDAPPMPTQPAGKRLKRFPSQLSPVKDNNFEAFHVEQFMLDTGSSHATSDDPHGFSSTANTDNDHAKRQGDHTSPVSKPSSSDAHPADSPYYFYQALLHFYLAPLDIRILKSAFGNFASFPSTLLPKVERVSTGHIVDNELRKRTKYLAHLPHGCEVGFLECDWADVVSPDILERFKHDIENRRKRNREKDYREEKDRQRAEKAEDDARWAAARPTRPSITDSMSINDEFRPSPDPAMDVSDSSPPWPSRQGSSFASLASPSTSPQGVRTVWGTTMIPPLSPELRPQRSESHDNDGWLPHWEEHLQNSEDALIAKVQAVSLENGEGSSTAPALPMASGRKKKAKKITLMSTTARRAA